MQKNDELTKGCTISTLTVRCSKPKGTSHHKLLSKPTELSKL